MGFNIFVYLITIGVVFLLTSPAEGTYAGRFEDRYERAQLLLEYPRDNNCLNCTPNASRDRNFPEVQTDKPKSRRNEVTDILERDEDPQRRPMYLPIALIMAKTNK